MTVGELIERLKAYPQDMRVVVCGFDESGFDDVETVDVVSIIQVREQAGHSGMYDEADRVAENENLETFGNLFDAVLINF